MALTASMEGGSVTKCRISHIKYKWCIENYSLFGKTCQDQSKSQDLPKIIPFGGNQLSNGWVVPVNPMFGLPAQPAGPQPKPFQEFFNSSEFSSHPNSGVKWRLCHRPNFTGTSESSLSVSLSSTLASWIVVECQLSVLGLNDEKLTSSSKVSKAGQSNIDFSCPWDEMAWKKAPGKWIPNDTLTVLCEMTITEPVLISERNRTFQLNENSSVSNECVISSEKTKGDIVLTSPSGRQVTAHKDILATRCPALYEIVEQKMKVNPNSPIEMDERVEVLEELIRYLYMGKVSRLCSMVEEMFQASVKYKIDSLKIICEQEFVCKMNQNNAADLLIFADSQSAAFLKDQIIDFLNTHVSEVSKTEGWKRLTKEHPHLVVEIYNKLAKIKT